MKKLNSTNTRLPIGIVFLFTMFIVLNSCEESMDDIGPGMDEVFIQGMAFSPATITVPVNTTITWINKDAVVHTVTSNTGLFDSGNMSQNNTFSYTFTIAGNYPYHCITHPVMTATVIVN